MATKKTKPIKTGIGGKLIDPNTEGRPTVVTIDVVAKLSTAFQKGLSDKTACEYARIDRSTYYRALARDESFATKMADAKNYQKFLATQAINETLRDKLHRDRAKVAMWLLERKEPEEFAPKPEVIINNNIKYTPPSWFKPPTVQATPINSDDAHAAQ